MEKGTGVRVGKEDIGCPQNFPNRTVIQARTPDFIPSTRTLVLRWQRIWQPSSKGGPCSYGIHTMTPCSRWAYELHGLRSTVLGNIESSACHLWSAMAKKQLPDVAIIKAIHLHAQMPLWEQGVKRKVVKMMNSAPGRVVHKGHPILNAHLQHCRWINKLRQQLWPR